MECLHLVPSTFVPAFLGLLQESIRMVLFWVSLNNLKEIFINTMTTTTTTHITIMKITTTNNNNNSAAISSRVPSLIGLLFMWSKYKLFIHKNIQIIT